MYENLIPIISLIFSVIAVVFTTLSVGLSFTLGFREREETSRRKDEIKSKLMKELEGEVTKFFEKNRKKVDEETVLEIMDLAETVDYVFMTPTLLENMTYYGNRFLRLSAFTLVYCLMFTLYVVIYWESMTDIFIFVFGIFIVAVIIILGYLSYSHLRKYYYLREGFLRLYEDPTLETCVLVEEDLEAKKVKRTY